MNETPTSGPIRSSITHHERDAISSRHSLARSQRHGVLGERKEHLLEIGRPAGPPALRPASVSSSNVPSPQTRPLLRSTNRSQTRAASPI